MVDRDFTDHMLGKPCTKSPTGKHRLTAVPRSTRTPTDAEVAEAKRAGTGWIGTHIETLECKWCKAREDVGFCTP
jgi:hypothetical protein